MRRSRSRGTLPRTQAGPWLTAKKHVTKVDMFTNFTTSSMIGGDRIHPNDSGYSFMADRWYSVIGPLLPK